MKIKAIVEQIEKSVPLKLAQDWDNVGLLIGDAQRNVKNILLTIDITKDVLAEAKRAQDRVDNKLPSGDLGRPEENHR